MDTIKPDAPSALPSCWLDRVLGGKGFQIDGFDCAIPGLYSSLVGLGAGVVGGVAGSKGDPRADEKITNAALGGGLAMVLAGCAAGLGAQIYRRRRGLSPLIWGARG